MTSTVPLDRFLRYAELTDVLGSLAAANPGLVALESIGRSHEGRDIWLVTVTDTSTGPHDEKPAMWVDANIHATEVTAGVAALSLLDHLVTGFGTDAVITRALRTRTFYVLPRLNPDGVELALADRPRHLRSSTRPWPWRDAWRQPGLHTEDIDGDGRILTMRVRDPDGHWTAHPEEPQFLVRRRPDADPDAGPYYRVLEEGLLAGHDGFTIPTPRAPEGLDLNRNYPAGWGTGVPGSGDHPGSEPEIDAVIRAMRARPNITGFNAYHTSGGVLLRPSSTKADSDLPVTDVWTWTELGRRANELTGLPVYSVFEDFTWDKKRLMAGASDDWAYEHLGIYAWTTEFWDAAFAATGTRLPTNWWELGPPEDAELSVMRWYRSRGGARPAYVDWYPFDHPQLGPVELGGWDWVFAWSNPPLDLLRETVRGHADFVVFQALAAPCLTLRLVEADPLGDGVWRVRAGLANTGWLPTTVTARAAEEHLVLPVTAEVHLPQGAALVDGPVRVDLGQLGGGLSIRLNGALNDGTPERALAAWLVRGRAGDVVEIEARHPRAGVVRASVTLR
jgi:murein tripeptide amidase MpaA